MKLRVETSRDGGIIVEYEGEGALVLAKLVLSAVTPAPSEKVAVVSQHLGAPAHVKILDWGTRTAAAIKVIRELWPGTTLEGAKKWLAIAPLVVGHPRRDAALARLREAGVEVE